MKLMLYLLTAACLQTQAGANAQKVTLDLHQAPLKKAFQDISRQTGLSILYDEAEMEHARPVTISVKEATVEEALAACLRHQGFNYSVSGGVILIRLVEKAADVAAPALTPPPGDLHGRILNTAGEPLAGANITIGRTKTGTITNAKGEFTLKNLLPEDILTISFIGYKSQKLLVGGNSNVEIKLQVTDNELDKVVIQAYGETSQRLTTGDMAVVTAAEIEKQPVMNPLMALQGRVAGLDIQQTSGYASAPIKVEIRGRSSVDPSQVSDPLYIVDGVPLTVLALISQGYNSGSSGFLQNPGLVGPAAGQSPLFSINPSDIESITILKDADATSIYGSRGANGVILITTKKGKIGKTHLDIHVDEGVNTVTRYWKLLNTPQYLAMRREAFRNDGIAPTVGNASDLLLYDTTRYTDWQKALYGRAGRVINTQVSLSGGDARTTYRIGATYKHSTQITTASGADQQASLSFNLTNRSSDQRFIVSLTSAYSFTQSDMISLPGSITYAPDAPAIFDSSGHLNWAQWDAAAGGQNANPFSSLLQPYTAKTNFLNTNLSLSFQAFRGLTLKTNLGYNNGQANQVSFNPIASQDPRTQPTGTSYFGYNSNQNWIIEPQFTYQVPIGPGNFNVLFGGSIQETTTDGIYILGQGYTSDALLHTITNASTQVTLDNYGKYRYASVFARIGYNIGNEYIFNLNARRDGSSNYGPGNEFGNFASVGLGWIFTEEAWFKKHLNLLSFGKLRGSYGTTGSDGGKPYGYITRWSSSGQIPYDTIQSLVATQHANPNYHWQLNKKFEIGLDMGFFRDWITFQIAYYLNRTDNQLLSYPTPNFSGFNNVVANLPALVENAGWEFTIGGRGVHTKYFSWAPSINFSINQNRFVAFPGLGSSPYRDQGFIGHPLNGLYLLHYTGVDPQTGQYTYQDKNHDGVINPNYGPTGDVYFKKISPSFSTGFGFNFDLKGFHLALFFSVKKQTGINAIGQGQSPGRFNGTTGNQPTEVLARWQKPGDITNTGKFSTIRAQDPLGYLGSSDIAYTDASYIRLQNLSLAYSFPDSYVKKAGMQNLSLFLHANNIFVITGYKGIDPETQSFGGLPPSRTIVGGLSVNF